MYGNGGDPGSGAGLAFTGIGIPIAGHMFGLGALLSVGVGLVALGVFLVMAVRKSSGGAHFDA